MLYQVKCKMISNEGKKDGYFYPLPDGAEAKNKKEAIKLGMAAIVNKDTEDGYDSNTEYGRVVSRKENDQKTYFGFTASIMAPDGTVYVTSEEAAYAFMDEVINKLNEQGYHPEEYSNACVSIGIRVATGVDTWIVDIRDSNGEKAQINLFHKNNFGTNNDTSSKIPGFHKQCSGRYTVADIINVMVDHGKKWKSHC